MQRARTGEARAVARLISLVEGAQQQQRAVAAALAGQRPRAAFIGITGPPGVGKSTLTSALVGAFRAAGERVGVLAVDPSSPFSGGALLGDRIRMQDHASDPCVFIRSMASRGHSGGLAAAVPQAVRVLDSAGCDVVVVETVGVGQAEFEIAALADTTVLVLAPGFGDGIQAAKAGILEVADVVVVNKADQPAAAQVARELRRVQAFSAGDGAAAAAAVAPASGVGWPRRVVLTAATTGDGVGELSAALDEHRGWLRSTGELARRHHARASAEITAIALAALAARLGDAGNQSVLDAGAARVAAGETDPFTAAADLLAAL